MTPPRDENPLDYVLDDRQVIHNHYHGVQNDRGGFGKLIDAILPLAVVGLVAVVWNLSVKVAELGVGFTALSASIERDRR